MRIAPFILLLLSSPVFADDAPLGFDTAKLCAWQHDHNAMDVAECTKLEDEAKAAVPDLQSKADVKRKDECVTEAKGFAVEPGFASYTIYAGCLKDGPGSL